MHVQYVRCKSVGVAVRVAVWRGGGPRGAVRGLAPSLLCAPPPAPHHAPAAAPAAAAAAAAAASPLERPCRRARGPQSPDLLPGSTSHLPSALTSGFLQHIGFLLHFLSTCHYVSLTRINLKNFIKLDHFSSFEDKFFCAKSLQKVKVMYFIHTNISKTFYKTKCAGTSS